MIEREPYPSLLTATERNLRCWIITGDELAVNDVVVFLSQTYRVDRFEPYEGNVYDPATTREAVVAGFDTSFIAAESSMFRIIPRVEPQPLGDHPHNDPGDGRSECDLCGKWVWPVTHSCKGVPVTDAARRRHTGR